MQVWCWIWCCIYTRLGLGSWFMDMARVEVGRRFGETFGGSECWDHYIWETITGCSKKKKNGKTPFSPGFFFSGFFFFSGSYPCLTLDPQKCLFEGTLQRRMAKIRPGFFFTGFFYLIKKSGSSRNRPGFLFSGFFFIYYTQYVFHLPRNEKSRRILKWKKTPQKNSVFHPFFRSVGYIYMFRFPFF